MAISIGSETVDLLNARQGGLPSDLVVMTEELHRDGANGIFVRQVGKAAAVQAMYFMVLVTDGQQEAKRAALDVLVGKVVTLTRDDGGTDANCLIKGYSRTMFKVLVAGVEKWKIEGQVNFQRVA